MGMERGRYIYRLTQRLNDEFVDDGAYGELSALLDSPRNRERRNGLWVASEVVHVPNFAISAAVASLNAEEPAERYWSRSIIANARGTVPHVEVAQALSDELCESPDGLDDPGSLASALLDELIALPGQGVTNADATRDPNSEYSKTVSELAKVVETLSRLMSDQIPEVPTSREDLSAMKRISRELVELERVARAAWARDILQRE